MKIFAMILMSITAAMAQAETCELTINSNDQMQFDQQEMAIDSSCTEVKLTLNHTGKLAKNIMGHNWVLTQTDDFQAVAQAGMAAGLDNNHVPVDDARVLAATEVIGGGESTAITFSTKDLSADGDYTFFCSFPGHWAIMKGTFKIN